MKKMKRIIVTVGCAFLLIALCSCKNGEENKQNAQYFPGNTPNPYGFSMEQAAQISGNRMEQVIKDKDKIKNSAKPETTENPNDEDTLGKMEGIESTPNPSGTPEMQTLTFGDFAKALSEQDLKTTEKLALDYAKTVSDKVSKVEIADDGNSLYKEHMLYNKGNIIVYTFKANGETKSVAIGRINSGSDWEVLK